MTPEEVKLKIKLTNIKLAHAWGLLSCVGYSTGHWIGASVALLLAGYLVW